MVYRRAGAEDLDLLVKTRIEVLRAANGLDDTVDMSAVEAQSRDYYRKALSDGSHVAYLVFDGKELAGAGASASTGCCPRITTPRGRTPTL